MSYNLTELDSKSKIDNVILFNIDKLVIIRFGNKNDPVTLKLDDILRKCEILVSKMASIFIVEYDKVPEYIEYFDIKYIPSTVFFFNTEQMKIDFRVTPDNTKFVGCFADKQDFIDLVEVLYKGAMKGKYIIDCPIPPSRIPTYELLYKDI